MTLKELLHTSATHANGYDHNCPVCVEARWQRWQGAICVVCFRMVVDGKHLDEDMSHVVVIREIHQKAGN